MVWYYLHVLFCMHGDMHSNIYFYLFLIWSWCNITNKDISLCNMLFLSSNIKSASSSFSIPLAQYLFLNFSLTGIVPDGAVDVWITWPTEQGCGFLNTSQNKAYGLQCWMLLWLKLQMMHMYSVPCQHCHCRFRTLPLNKSLAGIKVNGLLMSLQRPGPNSQTTTTDDFMFMLYVPMTHF